MSFPTVPLSGSLGSAGFSLRAWQPGDAVALSEIASELQVWRWMSDAFPHPYTLDVARHWVESGHLKFGGENCAVCHDGVAVGGAGYHPDSGSGRCNVAIGYFLSPTIWGQGVGTAVVAALTKLAFDLPDVTRVWAPVHAGNAASMRVLQKNDFVCEGTQRLSAFKAGRVIDQVIWACYREPGASAAPAPV